MIYLKGHAALVTGSTMGIGRAIAEAFAAAGANVVIHGRCAGEGEEAVLESCRTAGVSAAFVAADLLAEPAEGTARSLFESALETMPNIDILVNNAGRYFDVPFLEMTAERFEKTRRLNVEVPYLLTQAFARRWIEDGVAGRVLMVGSVNGRLAEVDSTAYDTSKGAVEMMVKTLCVTLAPRSIRINGLAPGLVRTPQTAWIDRHPRWARWIEYCTPNGRIPEADACGGGAV
jgi:glucose 1-dehydrogenase